MPDAVRRGLAGDLLAHPEGVRGGDQRRATLKLNIMPLCMCSAIWQWAIHRPGLVTSKRMSTVSTCTHQHGVLPDQVGLGDPVAGQHQESAGAVQVERVVHGMVGRHFIDQPDLDSVAGGEPPVDGRAVGAVVRSRNRQCMVALVVWRLTSTMSSSHSMPSARPWSMPAWSMPAWPMPLWPMPGVVLIGASRYASGHCSAQLMPHLACPCLFV